MRIPSRKSWSHNSLNIKILLFNYLGVLLVSMLVGIRETTALEVGEKAPDFTLPSTMGGQISLSQFQGSSLCSSSSTALISPQPERLTCQPGRPTTVRSRR